MRFDEIADELYGLDPGEFVAARIEWVKQAKAAEDKPLAGRIGKLRKPTQVAWVVNLLARELPGEVASLLELGDALRRAQSRLAGRDLRTLTAQRQQVVRVLAERAGQLAAERGHPVGEGALREVGQTLHAALADPAVAEQVRAGRLVTATSYDGFGPSGLTVVDGSVAAGEEEPEPRPPRRPNKADRLAAARSALAEAERALGSAREDLTAAADRADQASARVDDIDARIAELRDELDRAEQERQFVRSAERTAADARRSAERDVERAERRVARARDTVDDLDE